MRDKADLFPPELARLSGRAKALSHPARLEILRVLARHDTCICGEIVDEVPLAQSTVSQHLRVLKDAGLIQGTIEGPSVCYCLDPEALQALQHQLGAFFTELLDQAPATSSC